MEWRRKARRPTFEGESTPNLLMVPLTVREGRTSSTRSVYRKEGGFGAVECGGAGGTTLGRQMSVRGALLVGRKPSRTESEVKGETDGKGDIQRKVCAWSSPGEVSQVWGNTGGRGREA